MKLLLLIPTAVVAFWHATGSIFLIDDSFISFRYARNLAEGYGLVWNVGGEPTQGFTSFLYVLLLSLWQDHVRGALVLNSLGLLALTISFYVLSTRVFTHRFWSVVAAITATASVLCFVNVMSGMETVFWSGLLVSAMVALAVKRVRLAGALFLLAMLTRPESVLIFLLCSVFLWKRMWRVSLVVGGLYLIYATLAALYFGDFLPNSYYLKVTTGGLPGLAYVTAFLSMMKYYILAILVCVAILRKKLHVIKEIWPLTTVFALVPAFLFINPLMGDYFRFLFPCYVVGIYITAVLILKALPSKIALVLLVLVVLTPMISTGVKLYERPSTTPWYAIESTLGKRLGAIGAGQDLRVAYGDAGALPYYSGCYHIDIIGLNDNAVVRNKLGGDWLINYIYDQDPDLIGIATLRNGSFNVGHGLFAKSKDKMVRHSAFTNYAYVAVIRVHRDRLLHWFVKKDSGYQKEILTAFRGDL